MQTETQLCVISPETSQSPSPSDATDSSPYTSLPATASTPQNKPVSASTPSTTAYTYAAYGKTHSAYSAYRTTWVKATPPLSRAEKGYTVKDGPWLCKIFARGVVKKLCEVMDETSYKVLSNTLQNYNKMYPDIEHSVVIMHVSTIFPIFPFSRNIDLQSKWHESLLFSFLSLFLIFF